MMQLRFTITFWLLMTVASVPLRAAIRVVAKDVMAIGENRGRPRLFVEVQGKQIPLPQRNAYVSRRSSMDKNVWALNFHGASDFNSVDLIVWHRRKLFIIPNVWNDVEKQVKAQKIIPDWSFDHLIFEVERVQNMKLSCWFYGASHQKQATLSRRFSIFLSPQKHGVHFRIAR